MAGIEDALHEFLGTFQKGPVVYFPIRHHSPACAWHLDRTIRDLRPRTVLIEGPASLTALIPYLLHADTRPPVAVFSYFVDKKRRTVPEELREASGEPIRYGCYYPICDYSPELAALRAGSEMGAELRFIDLDFPAQVLAEQSGRPESARFGRLMRESYWQRNAYINGLLERTGCRDHNELWDHLFESNHRALESTVFARNVAAYCFLTRMQSSREEMEADGTLAREARMAAEIKAEARRMKKENDEGTILVVTGGFHTAGLVMEAPAFKSGSLRGVVAGDETAQALIRYSFDQLDALNGYCSGMPSPKFYQRLWEMRDQEIGDCLEASAREFLVDLARTTREKSWEGALSPADEIAALQSARQLAAFRGHPGPMREDILDAVRGCMVKGAVDTEGALLLSLAREMLSGREIGTVAEGAGDVPLLSDFRRLCRELHLLIDQTVPKDVSLDIYRKAADRKRSRFFHSLAYLGVPFAEFRGGPDFARGRDLERMQEIWTWSWRPQTDSRLVELCMYGSTVREACLSRLREQIEKLEEEGQSRSAAVIVVIFISACRMGLHTQLRNLVELTLETINEDPTYESVVDAASRLALLCEAMEPLEARDLDEVQRLLDAAWQRGCFQIDGLSGAPEERAPLILDAMAAMRDLLVSSAGAKLDGDIFWAGMDRLSGTRGTPPLISGGIAGISFAEDRITVDELNKRIRAHLVGSGLPWKARVSFLGGLLQVCREVSWQNRDLLDALDAMLQEWDDEEFLQALPHLRLAFSAHTPRETDRVAAFVTESLQVGDLGELTHRDIDEEQLARNLHSMALVRESLERDGVLGLLEAAGS